MLSRRTFIIASLLLSVTASACSLFATPRRMSTSYVPLRPLPHPVEPLPADQVEVFLAGVPARPFVEVAMLEVQETRGAYSSAELLEGLRQLAGSRGCDGLVLIGDNDAVRSSSWTTTSTDTSTDPVTEQPTSTTTTRQGSDASTYDGYRGSCIVFDRSVASAEPAVRKAQTSCESCSPAASD